MKFTTFLTIAPLLAASLVTAYPIKADNVNCRSGPGTSYSVKKVYKKGHNVSLTCQTTGTSVLGTNIWDKTTDGCYVSDYYVKTGSSGFVTKKCTTSTPSASYCKHLNNAGTRLIMKSEGFEKRPAGDPTGKPTVGYGHLCQKSGCAEVKYPFPLTKANGLKLLNDDIPKYTKCLAAQIKNTVKLNQNQWAALTSWAFNMGCGNTATSTLVKRLNKGHNPNTVAAEELPKWVYAGKKKLPGLVTRRKNEVKLFKTPTTKKAHPKCS